MGTLVLAGATSGSTTLTPVDAVTTVLTLPSATATLATLGANTFTGNQAVTGALTVSTTLGVTGTSTLAAVNASGAITSTFAANNAITNSVAGTTTRGWKLGNTGGETVFGMEGVSGGQFITGSTAYDGVLLSKTGLSFSANEGASVNLRISSAGAVTIPGTLGVTGLLSVGAGGINLTSATGTSYVVSSFTATLTGCTTSPTATFYYTVIGDTVTVEMTSNLVGESNTTACTVTGFPAAIRPTNSAQVVLTVRNNAVATISNAYLDSSGVLSLQRDSQGTAFTTSGSKGAFAFCFTYKLI